MRDVGLSARGPGGRMLFRLGWVMPYPIAYSITPSTTGRNAYRALMLLPSIRLSKNSPPFERQRKEYSFGRGLVKPVYGFRSFETGGSAGERTRLGSGSRGPCGVGGGCSGGGTPSGPPVALRW